MEDACYGVGEEGTPQEEARSCNIYARVSTLRQESSGALHYQIERCREYAQKKIGRAHV